MQVSGFTPRNSNIATPNANGSVAVTASVQQITIPGLPAQSETVCRFVASGTQAISWCYGSNANLTATNGCIQLGNTVEIFGIPVGVSQISVIAASTGTTLYIIPGDGL